MIDERRASGEDKGDLLSMLLLAQDEDDGRMMTDQQVRDEATTLFIAGHETTANALSWILYLLAQHPEVEAKLLDELETLLAGRPPTVDDLHRLRYTEMIVKESMRLYPPAWIISRFATEDVEVGDYTLKAGSIVLISQYVMHRHPDHWAEPECFIPERFEDESRIPKYVYFPFGGGPRICIGNHFALMEATLVLATLMQRIQFALEPGQQIKPLPLITLRPSPAILMRVAAREPAMVAL
jgi:cytochrome P450